MADPGHVTITLLKASGTKQQTKTVLFTLGKSRREGESVKEKERGNENE